MHQSTTNRIELTVEGVCFLNMPGDSVYICRHGIVNNSDVSLTAIETISYGKIVVR
jgi:hypothetical protein